MGVWLSGRTLRFASAQVLIHPTSKQKTTVDQVNSNAPVYTVPGVRISPMRTCASAVLCFAPGMVLAFNVLNCGVGYAGKGGIPLSGKSRLLQGPTIKPQLMTGSGMLSQTAQQSQQAQGTGSTPVSPGQQITSAQPYQTDTSTATGGATTTVNVGGKTITINVSSPVLQKLLYWCSVHLLHFACEVLLVCPDQQSRSALKYMRTHGCIKHVAYRHVPYLCTWHWVRKGTAGNHRSTLLWASCLPSEILCMQVPQEGNPEQATGSYIAGIAGVRISTPIFGTGFNFCIGACAASMRDVPKPYLPLSRHAVPR